MVLAEVALQHAQPDHRQHDRAQGHVQAMEAGQHEEGRAVDAAAQGEVELVVGLDVLVRLEVQEGGAQQHGQAQEQQNPAAMPGAQGVVGDRHGDAGGQQDQRVQQRQPPRRHRFERPADLRRTIAAVGTPGRGVVAPQELVGQYAMAFATEPRHREHADVEQRTEERTEEHHLGEDEPHHPHAERGIDLVVVVAGQRFADDRTEPAEEHPQHADHAEDEHRFAETGRTRLGVEPVPGTEHEDEHDDRGDDRPVALGRYKVNVVLLTHAETPWISLDDSAPPCRSGTCLPVVPTRVIEVERCWRGYFISRICRNASR